MFRILSLVFLFISSLQVSADVFSRDENKNCTCGFYDTNTKEWFTESLVVYFNETESLPKDFIAEKYENKYEIDWNAVFRQGADPANVRFNKSDSLQLAVQPATDTHLVNGGGIRTARQDIQHGSFRTFMRSPSAFRDGTAMSMIWRFNETEMSELSVMNTNDPTQAWIGTFIKNEYTTRDLGVNFTQALSETAANRNYTTLGGGLSNGSVNPWDYTEYRIDWTKDYVNFYLGGNLTRSILYKDKEDIPSVPAPFYFKHWSTGNRKSMRGPPKHESIANIAWIRMFFNSSAMTDQSREDFVARCPLTEACSMDDASLRGSTPYTELSTLIWKQVEPRNIKRLGALILSIICISFSSVLLLHAFIRRATMPKQTEGHGHAFAPTPAPASTDGSESEKADSNPFEAPENTLPSSDSSIPSVPTTRRPSSEFDLNVKEDDLAIERAPTSPGTSVWGGSTQGAFSRGATPRALSPYSSNFNTTREELPGLPSMNPARLVRDGKTQTLSRRASEKTIAVTSAPLSTDKIRMETVTESALPPPRMRPQPPPPRQRIDYLAGLTAMCSLFVTIMHFGLTFVPAMVMPGAHRHHISEYWAQQIIAPFFLNQMWLGVFFTTSVRFLTMGYLKKGKMEEIAKAAVRRTPRLMIPVASIALLEYFLVDVGATHFLRYLPSVTWSTWPYVARYPTAGHYVSEVLELIYLVPNAVPQITFNYCTGVLWTIAVQLQGTWLVLLGAIIVYEIKTPWKRMGYYAFCIINHWYAQTWGSYLWFGLLLTDLDITYKYKDYLKKSPAVHYPVLTFMWFIVALGFAANVIPNWYEDFNFSTLEHDIHPDWNTGEPYKFTDNAGYPPYYVPRLNGLLFAAGMQGVVEISTCAQWVLSTKFFLLLFPHIFTIYLLHGMVFWSWGSWLMIFLTKHGLGYGLAVAIVGFSSYGVLFAILPIITPIIEALGKDVTALVWMTATEKSPPRRRTLFPFPDNLFKAREENNDVESGPTVYGDSVVASSGRSSPSEKGKAKEQVQEINPFGDEHKIHPRVQVRSAWE
jgi:hypothetical protein